MQLSNFVTNLTKASKQKKEHFTFLRKNFCNFLWGSFIIFFSPSRIQVRHCKYLSHSAGARHLLPSLLTRCSQLSSMRHQTPAQPRNRLKARARLDLIFESNKEALIQTLHLQPKPSAVLSAQGGREQVLGLHCSLKKKKPCKVKKGAYTGARIYKRIKEAQRCSVSHWSFQIPCYRRNSTSRTLNTTQHCLLSAACHCAPVN